MVVVWNLLRATPGLLAGGKAEAVAIHLQNVDMVREAIEERAGEPLRPEHARPFIEWQVAGDQGGAAFIALAEHFEEQFRTNSGERHVAQLIDNQQLDGVEVLLQSPEAAFVAGFHEFVHESGSRGEGDAVALLAGRQSQSQGDVGLAGARGPKRDAVLALVDPFASRASSRTRALLSEG